jgi:hypothetical protein
MRTAFVTAARVGALRTQDDRGPRAFTIDDRKAVVGGGGYCRLSGDAASPRPTVIPGRPSFGPGERACRDLARTLED